MGKTSDNKSTQKSKGTKSRQPEKKIGPFANGNGIGVSIWQNTAETADGPRAFRSFTISPRRYRDKDTGDWKDAASFNPSDIPVLLFSLQKAQEYCFEHPLSDASQDRSDNGDGKKEEEEPPY